jgi:hypothetical protein
MNQCLAFAVAVLVSAVALAQEPASPDVAPKSESPGSPAAAPNQAPVAEQAKGEKPPDSTKPLSSHEAADILSEEELAQIIDLLRNNYTQPGNLTDAALARAGVQGLLDRLGTGARVYSKVSAIPESQQPLRSEILEGSVGYLRLGSLSDLGALDAALEQLSIKPPTALVLDLRATPHSTDFELAAEVCRRFAPKGRILFSIKRPKVNDEEILTSRDDPRWRGLLVVLVDGDTAGASEVIAAVLRTHLRAYVVGQQTKGEAAQFDDLPLASGKVLRVAVGEVSLPDNSPVFPGGLRPDLVVPVSQEKTDEILVAALAEGVAPLIVEKERPRMNEAALVAGTNPELDALQERQKLKEKGEAPKAALRDETLQRALDYITTVRIYDAARAAGRR